MINNRQEQESLACILNNTLEFSAMQDLCTFCVKQHKLNKHMKQV